MTKYTDDTKKSFSAMNNRFLIDLSGILRVKCIDCGKSCSCIALPTFFMYFCENPHCPNNLELRYYDSGEFELHDYGAVFKDADFQVSLKKLIEDETGIILSSRPKLAKIYPFPVNEAFGGEMI